MTFASLSVGAGLGCGGAQGSTGGASSATGGATASTGTQSTGSSPTSTGSTGTTATGTTATGTTTGAGMTTTTTTSVSTGGMGQFGTVFTIVLENHDYAEVVGSANAPYINSLIAQGGLATNYFDSGTHPSLPNYLYLISGDTQYPGYLDVDPTQGPYFPASGENLGHQMQVAGTKWRSYQESAGGNCVLSSNNNHYAPKHDPFLYFTQIQNDMAICQGRNVDYSSFATDLATNSYKYMWITPNLIDDGHDPVDFTGSATDPVGSLKACDMWLSTEVPKILSSQAYQQNGVLFITWDEAEGRNGDDGDKVPMIILSPKLKMAGMKSATHFTHLNYLSTVEDILQLPRIATTMGKPNMMEFFQ